METDAYTPKEEGADPRRQSKGDQKCNELDVARKDLMHLTMMRMATLGGPRLVLSLWLPRAQKAQTLTCKMH